MTTTATLYWFPRPAHHTQITSPETIILNGARITWQPDADFSTPWVEYHHYPDTYDWAGGCLPDGAEPCPCGNGFPVTLYYSSDPDAARAVTDYPDANLAEHEFLDYVRRWLAPQDITADRAERVEFEGDNAAEYTRFAADVLAVRLARAVFDDLYNQ